jgi:hypothetical protein
VYLGLGGGTAIGVLSLVFWGLRTLDETGKRKDQYRRERPAREQGFADGSFLPPPPGREDRR